MTTVTHIEVVCAKRVLPLRHAVLRAGLPATTARFEQDEDPQTLHLAAIEGGNDAEDAGEVVGCVTLIREALDSEMAWRLRGMAVAGAYRGRGVGAALLHEVDRQVGAQAREGRGPSLLWCNARTQAIGFYERQGWTTISDRFDVPNSGPHVRMCKRV